MGKTPEAALTVIKQNRSLEDLREWVPYNEFIGDLKCLDTHLVEVVEEWKDINGFEGVYQVSSFGRIKSLSRLIIKKPGNYIMKAQIIALSTMKGGYLMVRFFLHGQKYTKSISRLVAQHFIQNPDNKPEVNHKLAHKPNNRAYNLEWATKRENTDHAIENKLNPPRPGIANPQAKLTESDVLKIRELYPGKSYKAIAEIYNIDFTNVALIVKRKSWQHI